VKDRWNRQIEKVAKIKLIAGNFPVSMTATGKVNLFQNRHEPNDRKLDGLIEHRFGMFVDMTDHTPKGPIMEGQSGGSNDGSVACSRCQDGGHAHRHFCSVGRLGDGKASARTDCDLRGLTGGSDAGWGSV
jgi:hypothetical protein